jgi:ACS family D-galactonate transporter-like MFS transporter
MILRSATYRWNIVLLLCGSQAIAYIDRVNLSVVGPFFIHKYGYTPQQLGLLFSIFNWAFTLSLLVAGPVTDLIRPRLAYPAGVTLWSVATALCGLTTSFWPLMALRALIGIGEAPMIPAGQRVIRETYDKTHRTAVVGTFFAGNKIGLTVGIPLSSVLLAWWGPSWAFYITGALGLAWTLWWAAVYRSPTPAEAASESASEEDAATKIRWITLLKYRNTWGIMLGTAGYLYIYYVFVTWVPGYLVIQRHMSVLKTGFIGMLPFLIGSGCTILGGWAGDRLIAAGWRTTRVRKGFSVGGLFAAMLCTLAGAYTSNTALAVSFLILAVAAISFATAAIQSMAIDVAPRHIISSLVSLQNFGGNVGGSFAPIVTGYLISNTGSFTIPLLVASIVVLVLGCGGFGLIVTDLDQELQAIAPGA